MNNEQFSQFFQGYLTAAFWSSTNSHGPDNDDTPMDAISSPDEIDAEQRARLEADCRAFTVAHWYDLEKFHRITGRPWDHIGHDFWLTRNGHGAGFWDRGAGIVGQRLTDAVGHGTEWSTVDLYLGDDGKPYFSGFESYENKRGA